MKKENQTGAMRRRGIKGEGAIKALPGFTKPDIIEATAAHCPEWGSEDRTWGRRAAA